MVSFYRSKDHGPYDKHDCQFSYAKVGSELINSQGHSQFIVPYNANTNNRAPCSIMLSWSAFSSECVRFLWRDIESLL